MADSTQTNERQPRQGDLIMPAERPGFQGPLVKQRKQAPIKKTRFLGYAALILLVLLVFSPILTNEVIWSPHDQVDRSAFTKMDSWSTAWSIDNIRNQDPISLTTYFLEAKIPLPLGVVHHSINILLHLGAALLLLQVLQRFELPGALTATLAFALHPTTVQTVFWSGYRNEIIGLIAILAALFYGLRNKHSADYLLTILLTACACLIHKAAFSIPVIIALYTLFQKRHFKLTDYNRILPLLCICLFLGVWISAAPQTNEAAFTSGQRLYLIGQNMHFYLQQAVFPLECTLFYPGVHLSERNLNTDLNLLPFVIFIPFFILAITQIRRKWSRAIILGLTSYLVLILPSLFYIGYFIDGSFAKEDHGLYVALPAILALMICGTAGIARRAENGTRLIWRFMAGVLMLFEIGLTSNYTYAISQPTQMWEQMMAKWPESWVPKAAYIESVHASDPEGLRKQELIDLLENILQKQPELIDLRILLARSFREAGQPNNAIREYARILRNSEPDEDFLNETIQFFESMGLQRDADIARKRLKSDTDSTTTN